MPSDTPRSYIGYLPPAFGQADAAGSQVLDTYLGILQTLLGPAPDPLKPDPKMTVVREALAAVIDALPDLFYPRLSFLFPESDEFIPPLNVPSGDEEKYRPDKMTALNDYFGIADPQGAGDEERWKKAVFDAVRAWLSELLAWQAAWVGFEGDANWTLDNQRLNMATILPLFRQRGTAAGLEALLAMRFPPGSGAMPGGAKILVRDITAAPPMTVGVTTALRPDYGEDVPALGGVRPFSFVVEVIADADQAELDPVIVAMRRVIDQEKPAHTTYTIVVKPPED